MWLTWLGAAWVDCCVPPATPNRCWPLQNSTNTPSVRLTRLNRIKTVGGSARPLGLPKCYTYIMLHTVQWRHQLLYFFQGNFLVLIYLSPQQGRDTLVDVLQPNEWRDYSEWNRDRTNSVSDELIRGLWRKYVRCSSEIRKCIEAASHKVQFSNNTLHSNRSEVKTTKYLQVPKWRDQNWLLQFIFGFGR